MGRDYHCGFIGYQIKKKPRESVSSYISSGSGTEQGTRQPVMLSKIFSTAGNALPSAGNFIPPVAKVARKQCELIGNQVNSQEGRDLNAVIRCRCIYDLTLHHFKCVHSFAGKLKRRNCDGLKEPENVKRKALTKVKAIDSVPCLELEVCLSLISQLYRCLNFCLCSLHFSRI